MESKKTTMMGLPRREKSLVISLGALINVCERQTGPTANTAPARSVARQKNDNDDATCMRTMDTETCQVCCLHF